MNHCAHAVLRKELEDFSAITDIQRVVREALHLAEELFQAPRGVTLRTEEIGAHIVVDAVYVMDQISQNTRQLPSR